MVESEPSRSSISVKAASLRASSTVYSIIEGDALVDVLESINYHIKIVPTADGGSICKNRSIYNTKGDAQITEEKIKEGKEKATGMFKAVEAYLQANPDAYN
ncbi:Major allergen Pru ar 1 [Forsythia ovata]|uniref:Major allergen Pru ar 1 n=1 Tax=Forsythia ovata TaxID=205694 RepID=A0ABD1PHX6_9LAMI